MTPLVFHAINFSASQVGRGLALSALIGTIIRLLSGFVLDKGLKCSWPIRLTTFFAVGADLILFRANSLEQYLIGQLLIGMAAGLYWPAIELGVPLSCDNSSTNRAFALVRSADAFGIGLGALLGTVASNFSILRYIYIFEAFCMILVLISISYNPLIDNREVVNLFPLDDSIFEDKKVSNSTWLLKLIPLFLASIVATGVLTLQQSALPLDLVKGSQQRAGLSETNSGGIIALQLFLLILFQWPIGRWLAKKSVSYGLSLSLGTFSISCLLLSFSSLITNGASLIIFALIPMALAQAAFLPTATRGIIEQTPKKHNGIAMALFSQCFTISAVIAPLIAGYLLDYKENGLLLWMFAAITCLSVLPLLSQIKSSKFSNIV